MNDPTQPEPAGPLVDSLGCVLELEPGDIPTHALVLVAVSSNEGVQLVRHGASLNLEYLTLRGMLAEAVDNTTGWPTP